MCGYLVTNTVTWISQAKTYVNVAVFNYISTSVTTGSQVVSCAKESHCARRKTMVKKIKLVEEEQSADELDQMEHKEKMLELLNSMDWKMWEMYNILRAWAERENLVIEQDDPPVDDAEEEIVDEILDELDQSQDRIKSIIVDEDE